jgi:polyphosphate kinase 2
MAPRGTPVASLGEVQPAELHLEGAWRAAAVLGWRFDDDGVCRARVRVEWAGAPRVVWAPLELLRLPEPEPTPEPPAAAPAPQPAADVVVRVPPGSLPSPHRAAAPVPRPRRPDRAPDPGRWTFGRSPAGGVPPLRRPETWREDHPYPELLRRRDYEAEKRRLQVGLAGLQTWVREHRQRVAIVVEGRAAAGAGGAVKRFTEHLDPSGARVVALGEPTERERTQWFLQRYVQHLPAAGEIVLFDRSWYHRAAVERVAGTCTDEAYAAVLRETRRFERMLVADGMHLVKLWFSVSRSEQRTRFALRRRDPVRQWKLSVADLDVLDRWDDHTAAEEALFAATSTPHAPWTVVRANDKKRARLEAMRHVLSVLPHPGRGDAAAGRPDPLIVQPAPALRTRTGTTCG